MARTSAAAYRRRPRSSSWSRNAAYRSSMARSSIIRPYIEATNALGTPSADPTQLPNQSWLFLRVALAYIIIPGSIGSQCLRPALGEVLRDYLGNLLSESVWSWRWWRQVANPVRAQPVFDRKWGR